MARIGMISSKVRGTPVVFIAPNPSGSLIALAQQGYPIDDASGPRNKLAILIGEDDLYL